MTLKVISTRQAALTLAACAAAFGATVLPPAHGAPEQRPPARIGQEVGWSEVSAARQTERELGADGAGTYFDHDRKTMVVNATDAAAAREARQSGEAARVVEHSGAALGKVTGALKRSTDVTGTAWAVDPASNTVVVSADKSVDAKELRQVRAATSRFGDRVRIERVAGRFSTTISGGEAILGGSGGRCSLGFNVRSGSGTPYFLTAGHCTDPIASWYTSGGSYLGPTVGSSFPGNDYGIVRHDNSLAKPGSVYLYGAGTQDITRAANAYVGERVRRSGSTTGVRSGTVQALNATVRYAEGTVTGLIQTNVCAEPGDSGGSLFDGTTALGLTSGGSGNCSSGGTTYFQPVTEALGAYGVSIY